MAPLIPALSREIRAAGPISFARFMEVALYDPTWGYYERPEAQVGRGGDFYTNVSVGSLFGEFLGFRFARWLAAWAGGTLHLVEGGAHDGRLAADLLGFLDAHEPVLAERIEYWLVEPSARRRARQAERLQAYSDRVRWVDGWSKLPRVRGVIFSNELLDAMPVHRLAWRKDRATWVEMGVGWEREGFVWVELPGDAADLAPRLPGALERVLPDGYAIEVCPASIAWWRSAAGALDAGWLLTVDYGDGPGQRFPPGRMQGTLRAYCAHHASGEVLANPGEQDLTAHVDFEALQAAGEAVAMKTDGLWRQEQFLGEVLRDIAAGHGSFPAWTPARMRQCQTLLHPAHLGTTFKAFMQHRDGE